MKSSSPLPILILLVLLLPLPARAADIAWQTDYDAALAAAADAGKPLLLDFSASWCGPCKMMEANTFSNPTVQETLSGYVAVRVDFDKNPALVGRYHVQAIPTLVVLNRFGETVAASTGYLDADKLNKWLAANRPAAFAETSKLQAARAMVQALESDLQSTDPAVRERGLARLLESYVGKDEFAKASEKILQGMVDQQPEAMLPRLNDPRLAVRILLANQFAQKRGPGFAFDPWAPAEVRDAALAKMEK